MVNITRDVLSDNKYITEQRNRKGGKTADEKSRANSKTASSGD